MVELRNSRIQRKSRLERSEVVFTQPGPKADIGGAGRLAEQMPLLKVLECSGNPNYLDECTTRVGSSFPFHATVRGMALQTF